MTSFIYTDFEADSFAVVSLKTLSHRKFEG